jgi:hypothetical protein
VGSAPVGRTTVRALVGLTAVVALVSACASGDQDAEEPKSLSQLAAEARSRGYDWQAGILDDGDITAAEFDEGHRRNLQCLSDAGIEYTEPEREVLDGYRWNYDILWGEMDPEVVNDTATRCQDEFATYLELGMSSWGDWQTEPAVLAEIVRCVTDLGFEVDGGALNYRDVWLSASGQGLTSEQVSSCVASAMQRLHPGVGYGLGL